MKTNMLIIAALAFSVNAFAQNTCGIEDAQQTPVNTDDKMASMNQKSIGNFRVSVIDPSWVTGARATAHYNSATAVIAKDGYRMVTKDGHQTGMLNYTTVKNGNLVLINGVVISRSGEMLFLKDGDSIDMQGLVTRNQATDNAVAAK
jgi:uncharacterized protein YdeI (BOF family)